MLTAALVLTAPMLMPRPMADRPIDGFARVGTFPETIIRKAESQHEWAFSIDEGTLTCVKLGEDAFVFFGENLGVEEMGETGGMKLPRSVVVTTNPLAFLATVEDRELYAPYDTLETLIRRLAPFEAMGRKLCAEDAQQKKI